MNKSMVLSLLLMFSFGLSACGTTQTTAQKEHSKEYQKRSAEASDQQLDREVDRLNKSQK